MTVVEALSSKRFADLLSLCAPQDGGSPSANLIGVWPVEEAESAWCDVGRCRGHRDVMLVYLHKKKIFVVFLCREHALEAAKPKDGDLLTEFVYRVLRDKDRETLSKAALRPSKSARLREYGLTTSVGTLTRLGRAALKRLGPAS